MPPFAPQVVTITADQSAAQRRSLRQLVGTFFASPRDLGDFTAVDTADLPPAAVKLLAHQGHMTVTLERTYGGPVQLSVLQEVAGAETYSRNSLLSRQADNSVVQFGVMQIDLVGLPQSVRQEIETHAAPLGRVLIKHQLLREVELLALWKIKAASPLAQPLALPPGAEVYGRTAVIHVAGQPRIDLLEIVRLFD